MPIVLIGLSHHSSPVTVRERFAFAEARIPAVLQLLRDHNVLVQPGYFYDFDSEAYLVISLLTEPKVLLQALPHLPL